MAQHHGVAQIGRHRRWHRGPGAGQGADGLVDSDPHDPRLGPGLGPDPPPVHMRLGQGFHRGVFGRRPIPTDPPGQAHRLGERSAEERLELHHLIQPGASPIWMTGNVSRHRHPLRCRRRPACGPCPVAHDPYRDLARRNRSGLPYNQMVVYQASDAGVDRIFHALADGTRRDILALAVTGGYSVSALAKRYPMSFAAVQKHVAVLEGAGLITKERRGRERLVRTDVDTVQRARVLLDGIEGQWRARVDRIDDLLATEKRTTGGKR